MVKVTFIGAGSAVFSRQLIQDILLIPGLDGGTFALVDIDEERLDLAHRLAGRLIEHLGGSWEVTAHTERRRVMADSDYLVHFIDVAGLAAVRLDHDIPLRFGIKQVIGDTIGPGGLFKALRTGPVWLDILADAEELCPDALVLNYTNPMSILTMAGYSSSTMDVTGLCHSVQETTATLADYTGVPLAELEWTCAGINHNAWFTRLSRDGEDLYPLLHEKAREPAIFARDPYRFEVMRHLGAFVTESSGHLSEYVPWFRKRDDLIERFDQGGYRGETAASTPITGRRGAAKPMPGPAG